MTTLVDAAVKPSVSGYVANIHQRLDQFLTNGPNENDGGARGRSHGREPLGCRSMS